MNESAKPIIEHIVISGGSLSAWSCLGALYQSHADGFWDIQNIQTIYGTSMGSIIGTFVSLLKKTDYTEKYLYNWEILEEYFLKRPWHTVIKADLLLMMNSFQNCGIFDIDLIHNVFSPVFNALDISLDVTMAEMYRITQIEIHVYTIELATFDLIEISYKTHPDWKYLDAIYCSACIPFLLRPYKQGENVYIDGGFLLNYPLSACMADIERCKREREEKEPEKKSDEKEPEEIAPPSPKTGILGINRKDTTKTTSLREEDSLFDYVLCIFNKIVAKVLRKTPLKTTPSDIYLVEIESETDFFSLYKIFQLAESIQMRMEMFEMGRHDWKEQYIESQLHISSS
jgi:hypothetical protein